MNFSHYKTLAFTRKERILEIRLNRPDRLNAVNGDMHEELAHVFVEAGDDADSDILVLTGEGRAFSAGGDIDWLLGQADDPVSFEKTLKEGKRIVYTLLDCEKPVIAKINGAATGLGATIALFCDVIFAADHAKIGDPHVSVGLVGGDGGAIIWPQLIGYARAKEYLMTGDLLTAAKAQEIGLINHAVPAAELDAEVDRFANRLARGAIKAIRWTKISVNIGLKQLVDSILDASLAYESLSNITADHKEALLAFQEKRKPAFTGK